MVLYANVNTSTSQLHNTFLNTSTSHHHNIISPSQHYNTLLNTSPSHHYNTLLNTLLLLLREQQVEQYSEEEHNSDAVLCEHRAHNLGEYLEHLGSLREAEAHAERETHDNHVSLRETSACHHAETSIKNAAEHHDGAAAEHSLRNSSERMTHNGEHTADNHHQSADADREAVHNARHSSQAYVLTERRDWRTTEQTRHATYETVATDGCAHLLCLRVAVQRAVAQRRRIADSLRSRHKKTATTESIAPMLNSGVNGIRRGIDTTAKPDRPLKSTIPIKQARM